jgi:hypothetical protein
MKNLLFILCVIVYTLFGCDRIGISNQDIETIQKQKHDIEDLRSQVKDLRKMLDDLDNKQKEWSIHFHERLRNDLLDLSVKLHFLEFKVESDESIIIEPTSKNFDIIKTRIGAFLVKVISIAPYLNGYKIELNIGNIYTARFSGLSIKVKWGESYDEDRFSDHEKWEQSLNIKTFNFTEPIMAGKWNKIDFIIAPATAEQISFIELTLNTTEASLFLTN